MIFLRKKKKHSILIKDFDENFLESFLEKIEKIKYKDIEFILYSDGGALNVGNLIYNKIYSLIEKGHNVTMNIEVANSSAFILLYNLNKDKLNIYNNLKGSLRFKCNPLSFCIIHQPKNMLVKYKFEYIDDTSIFNKEQIKEIKEGKDIVLDFNKLSYIFT